MKAALVFDKVCASVGRNRLLLDGVSLEVPERGLLGIVGPNGSGKTTLLRAALGLMPLSAGQVLLGGRALVRPRCRRNSLRAANWSPCSSAASPRCRAARRRA